MASPLACHFFVFFWVITVSKNSFIPQDPGTRHFKGLPRCRIYLIRHGETANAHKICLNGHFDVSLSKKGLSQIEDIAQILSKKPIKAIYSSDLQRTKTGAEIIANHHSLNPIFTPDLRELSFGNWEGMSVEELNAQFPGELDKRVKSTSTFKADGGESFQQLHDRVIPKFLEIVNNHPNETIVIMSHGGVNRTILAHLLEFPIDNLFRIAQEYAAINIIQYYPDQVVVELMNGTSLQIA